MSEKDLTFDRMLEDSLTALPPPEKTVQRTNPWKRPMGAIAWGFALTTVHLGVLYLDYILPIAGMLLLYCGTRSLRRENGCFRAAWVCAAAYGLCHPASLFLATQPPSAAWPVQGFGYGVLTLQFLVLLALRAGVREVFRKADKPQKSDPLLWAVVWLAALAVLACLPLSQSWLAAIPVMIAYVLIVWSMYRLGGLLDDTGYYLSDAPVRVRGAVVAALYVAATAALVVAGCVHANHLSLGAEVYTPPAETELRSSMPVAEFPEEFPQETKRVTEFIRYGIPAETLEMLSDEQIALFEDAVWIETWQELMMLDPVTIEHRGQKPNGEEAAWKTYAPGEKNVIVTTTFVSMPDQKTYVVNTFTWRDGAPVWQDGIIVMPYAERSAAITYLDSALFYEKDGRTWTAPLPRWDEGTFTGALSYPFGAENQRGYVFYCAEYSENLLWENAGFGYYHMPHPLQLSYSASEDHFGGWLSIGSNESSHLVEYSVNVTTEVYEAELEKKKEFYEKMLQ